MTGLWTEAKNSEKWKAVADNSSVVCDDIAVPSGPHYFVLFACERGALIKNYGMQLLLFYNY